MGVSTQPTKLWISQFANLLTSVIKCALILPTWAYNQDVDYVWADCSPHETAGPGYGASGNTLGSKVLEVYDAALNKSRFTAANATWNGLANLTYRYAVVYNSSVAPNLILHVYDAGMTLIVSGDHQVGWHTTRGIIDYTVV